MTFYFASDISAGVLSADATSENNPRIGYENVADSSSITVTSEDADHPTINMLTPSTYDYWKASSSAVQNIDWTVGTNPDGVDYIALCGHNFHEDDGISVVLKRKATAGAAWTTVHSTGVITDSRPVVIHFNETTNPFIRIELTSTSGEIARVANLMVGRMLVFPRRVYVGHTPIDYSRDATISRAVSENGEYLGHTLRSIKKSTSVDFKNIDEDFYRSDITPFVEHAEQKPFVWCWRPEKYPDEIAYAWTTNDPKMGNDSNGRVSFSFDIMAKNYT